MATTSLEQDVRWPLVSQAQGPSEVEAVLGTVEHTGLSCVEQTNSTPNRPLSFSYAAKPGAPALHLLL